MSYLWSVRNVSFVRQFLWTTKHVGRSIQPRAEQGTCWSVCDGRVTSTQHRSTHQRTWSNRGCWCFIWTTDKPRTKGCKDWQPIQTQKSVCPAHWCCISVYWYYPITCPCLTSRNPVYFWESRTLGVSPTKVLSLDLPKGIHIGGCRFNERLNAKTVRSCSSHTLLAPWLFISRWHMLGLGSHICTLWVNLRTQSHSDGVPDPDGVLKTSVRINIHHYRNLYLNRPDPIDFIPLGVDTTGHLYDDFVVKHLFWPMICQKNQISFFSLEMCVSLIWRVLLVIRSCRPTPLLAPSLVRFPACSAWAAHTECSF